MAVAAVNEPRLKFTEVRGPPLSGESEMAGRVDRGGMALGSKLGTCSFRHSRNKVELACRGFIECFLDDAEGKLNRRQRSEVHFPRLATQGRRQVSHQASPNAPEPEPL